MSFAHPVIAALGTVDRHADSFQERRVKIINKYTHTVDPEIEVASEDESDSDEEANDLSEIDANMGSLLSELAKEQGTPGSASKGHSHHSKLAHDVNSMLRLLADAQGVLKGARPQGPVLSDEERALVAAVSAGDVAEVQRLLAVAGRGSLALPEGDTLLHVACRTPVDRVIVLIARTKPDLNAVNRRGRTPLHELALSGGSLVILGSLVKLGADPWARDHLGRLPVHYISSEQVRDSFEKLLSTSNNLPPNKHQALKTQELPVFTKSGKRCITDATTDTTVDAILDNLPADLAVLRPHKAHLTLIEYRRKNGDVQPKLSLLQGSQRVLELAATWNDDPCGPNPLTRLLLVPNKGAPRDVLDVYERAGFGAVMKK